MGILAIVNLLIPLVKELISLFISSPEKALSNKLSILSHIKELHKVIEDAKTTKDTSALEQLVNNNK